MIDIGLLDGIGYRSLFSSLHVLQGFKMYASSITNNNALMVGGSDRLPSKEIKSTIARRESIIYTLSEQLEGRYIYNNEGNFGRNYSPEPTRKSNETLKKGILEGLKVYNAFLTLGFDDKTLKDNLCTGYASLRYDGVLIDEPDLYKLGPVQVCTDALTSTLTDLKNRKEHSYNFLKQLGWQMEIRGLAANDSILLPTNENNHNALLKIVAQDLS